jgi:hypothetical protein
MLQAIRSQPAEPEEEDSLLDGVEKATTGARSYLEGHTLGLSEPVIGSANALIGNLIQSGMDAEDPIDFAKKAVSPSRIAKEYHSDVDERRRMKANHMGMDIGGQLTGAILPALLTGGASAPAGAASAGRAASIARALDVGGTVAGAAGKAVGLGANAAKALPVAGRGIEALAKASNPIVKGAVAIGKGAAQGAASAGASEFVRQRVLKNTGYMKDGEGPTIGEAMTTGAKWGAGLSALPQAYKAAKYLGAKGGKLALSVGLGPKVSTIDAYLANSERIKQAPSVEAIKDEMDTVVKKLQEDIDKGHLSVEEAKQVHKAVLENVRQVRTEAAQEFSRVRHGASEDVDRAERSFGDVVKGQKEGLKGIRAPLDLSGDVHGAIVDLKNMVSKGSGEAYDILDKVPGNIKWVKDGDYQALGKVADDLNIAGVGPATTQAAAAQTEIRALMNQAGKLPSEISFRDAKKFIQQLDRAEKTVYDSGQFTDEVGQAFKTLRARLDSKLKEIPEYRQKMEEVAAHTKLLKELQERFGDQRAIQAKIAGIHRPTAKLDYDALAALSSTTGKSFLGDIDEYANAQKLLANPRALESMQSATPEFADLAARRSRLERLQHPDAGRDFVDGAVKSSGLLDDEASALQRIQQAEGNLSGAESRQAPFKGISENSTQAKIEALMREKDPIHTRRQIESLDKEFGTDLSNKIEDRRVLDSFEKGNTNGSRNVNLGAIMGHNIGLATAVATGVGSVIAPGVGTFAGAVTGAVVDKYGPKMAKVILDQVIRIQGNPTLQKIQALNLPPDVKNNLSAQFIRHQGSLIRQKPNLRAVGQTELDDDSSRSSNYKSTPVKEEDARGLFIDGN